MSKKITRVVGGAMIAGALLTVVPAGLALADDVVNPPPTDSLNGGQANAVLNINKTPRSMGWDVRQSSAGWDVRSTGASWSWNTPNSGIGNNRALIGLLRPAPTG